MRADIARAGPRSVLRLQTIPGWAPEPQSSYPPARVLFLCTYNSARSQMAEGILRHLSGGRVAVYSAGSAPMSVHPLAVEVLAEAGVDISEQRAKHVDIYRGMPFDHVISLCDRMREVCAGFRGEAQPVLWSIRDPATVEGSHAAQRQAFARTARELTARIRCFLQQIDQEKGRCT